MGLVTRYPVFINGAGGCCARALWAAFLARVWDICLGPCALASAPASLKTLSTQPSASSTLPTMCLLAFCAGPNETFNAPGEPYNCSACYEPATATRPQRKWVRRAAAVLYCPSPSLLYRTLAAQQCITLHALPVGSPKAIWKKSAPQLPCLYSPPGLHTLHTCLATLASLCSHFIYYLFLYIRRFWGFAQLNMDWEILTKNSSNFYAMCTRDSLSFRLT